MIRAQVSLYLKVCVPRPFFSSLLGLLPRSDMEGPLAQFIDPAIAEEDFSLILQLLESPPSQFRSGKREWADESQR
jgi:hypothetical protein